jgi:hypothetical protein
MFQSSIEKTKAYLENGSIERMKDTIQRLLNASTLLNSAAFNLKNKRISNVEYLEIDAIAKKEIALLIEDEREVERIIKSAKATAKKKS